jgi:hypothetical protein
MPGPGTSDAGLYLGYGTINTIPCGAADTVTNSQRRSIAENFIRDGKGTVTKITAARTRKHVRQAVF